MVEPEQAEVRCPPCGHRHDREGDVGFRLAMALHKIGVIHAVQMVARQNEVLIDIPLRKEPQILAHGVCGAFKPTRAVRRLLGGEHFDKAGGETRAGQGIGARQMPIEGGGVECVKT